MSKFFADSECKTIGIRQLSLFGNMKIRFRSKISVCGECFRLLAD